MAQHQVRTLCELQALGDNHMTMCHSVAGADDVGEGSVWVISTPFSEFGCELKTTPKNSY
jgi:hypothetical protein